MLKRLWSLGYCVRGCLRFVPTGQLGCRQSEVPRGSLVDAAVWDTGDCADITCDWD